MATDCDDDGEQRILPDLDGDETGSLDDGDGVLVTNPSEKHALTIRTDLDEHEALVHGLASYVARLESAIAGRYISLTRVVTSWADHDDGAVPAPSAVVMSTEIGRHLTDSGMGQGVPRRVGPDGHGRYFTVQATAMYKLEELQVQVMCEDKIQRTGVRRMLVDAFSPVEWMTGFRLVLPRYHGAIAEYLLVSGQQSDGASTAQASLWPLTLRLQARCPVYRLRALPLARLVATGTITAG